MPLCCSEMSMFVVILSCLLVSASRASREQAAEAIQSSLFGGAQSQSDVLSVASAPEALSDYGGFLEPQVLPLYDDHRRARPQQKTRVQQPQAQYTFAEMGKMSVKAAPKQTNFYRPSTYENLPVIEECQNVQCHLSVAIILDSSGSVGYNNFQTELGFVQTLLEILAIKAVENGVKVCTGVVVYSSTVTSVVDPCCTNSICRVVDKFKFQEISYQPGSTNTHGALKVARQMLQAPASYKKVAILITDGKSNTGGSPLGFAEQMRIDDGIAIVALGVGDNVADHELMGIAGINFVTKIDIFDEFHELATILLEANAMDSDFEMTFEEMCAADRSIFTETCDRDVEPTGDDGEIEECAWGSWSNCVAKKGRCLQVRTCKLNGSVVKNEKQACACPDSSRLYLEAASRSQGNLQGGLSQPVRQRHRQRHGPSQRRGNHRSHG